MGQVTARKKDSGRDFQSCRAARRTCWLAPGSSQNTLSTCLMDRVEEDTAPRGFLTGRSLTYTKEGHTEALEESTPVSSSGLWAGALCWKLGFIYGEYHEPGAEMLTLLPAHIL